MVELGFLTLAGCRKDSVPGIRTTEPRAPVASMLGSLVHVLPVRIAASPNQ